MNEDIQASLALRNRLNARLALFMCQESLDGDFYRMFRKLFSELG